MKGLWQILLTALPGLFAGCSVPVTMKPAGRSIYDDVRDRIPRDGGTPGTGAKQTLRQARKLVDSRPEDALALYLSVAKHEYARVIEREASASSIAAGHSPAVQSYNQAVAGAVTALQKLPGGLRASHHISGGGTEFRVRVTTGDDVSHPGYYDRWLVAGEWTQKGLTPHYTSPGLGAALIATRENRQVTDLEKHQPDEGIFHPCTALLSFKGSPSRTDSPCEACLTLCNPVRTEDVRLGKTRWPLAADYTMPWAALISRTGALVQSSWKGVLRPAESPRPHRLYLMQPYMPDRIPVLMVHGLNSTPLVWAQLTNELMGDPEIRRRCQIWHYLYPTGFPPLSNAADLRDELEEVRRLVDPQGRDFATNHMIVIGHSMGGVMAHTLITDSGDAVWNAVFTKPVSALSRWPEEARTLQRWFYFQPRPWIKRVIFIAAPHRGSEMAAGPIGRLASRHVRIPDKLHRMVSGLETAVPGLLQPEAKALFARGFPDSIRGLSPLSKGLLALAERPAARGTPFHSIIGDRGRGDGPLSSDGVVAYPSAHLEGAESELIVPANHHTTGHPQSVAEVKRILRLHLSKQRGHR